MHHLRGRVVKHGNNPAYGGGATPCRHGGRSQIFVWCACLCGWRRKVYVRDCCMSGVTPDDLLCDDIGHGFEVASKALNRHKRNPGQEALL